MQRWHTIWKVPGSLHGSGAVRRLGQRERLRTVMNVLQTENARTTDMFERIQEVS